MCKNCTASWQAEQRPGQMGIQKEHPAKTVDRQEDTEGAEGR